MITVTITIKVFITSARSASGKRLAKSGLTTREQRTHGGERPSVLAHACQLGAEGIRVEEGRRFYSLL